MYTGGRHLSIRMSDLGLFYPDLSFKEKIVSLIIHLILGFEIRQKNLQICVTSLMDDLYVLLPDFQYFRQILV